jgi:hypothetical protein
MSTQRRENRRRRGCVEVARTAQQHLLALFARQFRAFATVGTAPPPAIFWLLASWFFPSAEDRSPGSQAGLATDSLRSDCHSTPFSGQLPQSDSRECRPGSPPHRAGRPRGSGQRTNLRSSQTRISPSSGFESLHPSLPQFPAGQCRWTERYDGKGNLHFFHAA